MIIRQPQERNDKMSINQVLIFVLCNKLFLPYDLSYLIRKFMVTRMPMEMFKRLIHNNPTKIKLPKDQLFVEIFFLATKTEQSANKDFERPATTPTK